MAETKNAIPDMRLLIPCYDLSTIRNSLQENLQLREIGAESGYQNVANSLYFSLLAANLGERLAPDCSLYQISHIVIDVIAYRSRFAHTSVLVFQGFCDPL